MRNRGVSFIVAFAAGGLVCAIGGSASAIGETGTMVAYANICPETGYKGDVGGGEFGVVGDFSQVTLRPTVAGRSSVPANPVWGELETLFQTFCVESGAHMPEKVPLTFTINEYVNGDPTRPIDPRTAYLYTRFWDGLTTPYSWTLGTARKASADEMQCAIWWFQGQWADFGSLPGNSQLWVAEANAAVGPGGAWEGMGVGGVRVLTLTDPAMPGLNLQDLLVIVSTDPPSSRGFTPGFWHNKNGQKLIDDADLAALRALNLVKDGGSAFDPTSKQQIASWINGVSATNMAAKLSAFVAAMKLNVLNGFVHPASMVHCGTLVHPSGKISIGALLGAANAELGLHPSTPPGSPFRAYQGALKDALDAACNNTNWI